MPTKIIMLILLLSSMLGSINFTYAVQQAITEHTFIYKAHYNDNVPKRFVDVVLWNRTKNDLNSVSLSGGAYWMISAVKVNQYNKRWVINVNNSIVESVDYWLLGDDGSSQAFNSGYYAPYEFLFDYGRSVEMDIGVNYWLVARVESRYYSSQPKLEVQEYKEHKRQTDIYALFIILCLGGLLFIALYNGLIYLSIRDKAFLYYAGYVLCYLAGWSFTFHLPAHLFELHSLQLHHLFFIGLPIFNILFYKHFLQLPETSPTLWRLSFWLLCLCIIALPSSIFLLSYTAIIASLLIFLWITLAMICGNVCLLKGFYPARYFLLAFSCLLLPAIMILPGNMGLTPDFFDNAELATLVGGSVDALLLSFALAYKIRLLSEEREQHIETLEVARKNARTDKLTGLANRLAFDEAMYELAPEEEGTQRELYLVLVSLDGVVPLTKRLGHREVDNIICAVAKPLKQLFKAGSPTKGAADIYRITESNFVIICGPDWIEQVQQKVGEIQSNYLLSRYREMKINIGFSLNTGINDHRQWLRMAEQDLYNRKSTLRRAMYNQSL
ncbi:7TM diverse intracellular signaling domain-containing protein [Shewanella pneumatophori]|uniref:Diguanylate cyclase n=1 Tax=Shewanella pneumatophori TaxID=314092 RepID=A0A9X1ZEQ1_9GAMM|nr:7TM diverse intracellular signaling domain-containing protein [Shewanella pneumatophori]MCL1138525.1 diguanylate cyclase [Shewanella pneumatophori]